jgi:glycosyltransferase involved in cell wall biosynthesis
MAVVSDLTTDARVRREAAALSSAGHDVTVIGFSYSVATLPSANGVQFVLRHFPPRGVHRWRRLLGAGIFFLRVSRLILKTDADAYHAHNHHLAFPCLAAARRRRVPFIYDAHEMYREFQHASGVRLIVSNIERTIWRHANATITTNDYRRRYFEFVYGPPSSTVLANVPPLLDGVKTIDLRGELGIGTGEPILLYQGGISHEDRCFDMVARALEELPEWHWIIIGFGQPTALEQLRVILRKSNLEARTHILPSVAADELPSYTPSGDIGLIPLRLTHLTNYLGDTNKMFEYMKAGLPSVGSDFPEIRRILVDGPDGPCGSVFDPNDWGSILRAIRQTIANREEMGLRAENAARNRHCWNLEQQKLVALYDRISLQSLHA